MELLIGIYLVIAGTFYAGYKDGIIKDDTMVNTYQFEARAAETRGDKVAADYFNGRLQQLGYSCEEKNL